MFKHKLLILFLFLSIITVPYVRALTTQPLFNKIIYIDPGHGGRDPGAIYKDIKESDINLQISNYLEEELTKLGATVYLTRYEDVDLSPSTRNRKKNDLYSRVKLINNSNCDLYISIHLNSIKNSTWYGAQVFYDDINAENIKIADIFQQTIKEELSSSREYKEITDIYLNKNITRPGILVEAGFLSNSNERYLLKTEDYQRKIAKTLANASIKYLRYK